MNHDDYIIDKDELDNRNQLFFHLPFHPSNPNSIAIQKIWQDNIATPFERPKLVDMKINGDKKSTLQNSPLLIVETQIWETSYLSGSYNG
jgi:hypothetical protein